MIPLIKNTFLNETNTKRLLSDFVLRADRLSMGERCFAFEREFASYQRRKEAVLFNSGGSANLALLQALKNLGRLTDGDRVGFSALTWSTNTMPIIQMSMAPVPIDCEPATLNAMSANLRDRLKSAGLRAFFTTNALGFAGDLDVIRDICHDKDILLLEDNCESLGTELASGRSGNFGLAATFSFYVAHHMSTIEGGMVCTDDGDLAEMLKIVRANGWDRNLSPAQQDKWRKRFKISSELEAKYTFYDLGYNLRPTEITGFLGLTQLPHLSESIARRQFNHEVLEGVAARNPDLLVCDHAHIVKLSSFAFPVICRTAELRDKYASRFASAEVEIRPVIAGNIQRQPFYDKYVKDRYSLPGADFVHRCGFYCANNPDLTDDDLEVISNCLTQH